MCGTSYVCTYGVCAGLAAVYVWCVCGTSYMCAYGVCVGLATCVCGTSCCVRVVHVRD